MKVLSTLTKWLAYFLACCIILAATLSSIGTLLTPYLNEHRAQFENWAADVLHTPVAIQHISITWHAYMPALTFEKVEILDKKTKKPTFEIEQIKVNLSILDTLISRKWVLSYLKISGVHLSIREDKLGLVNIEGFGHFKVTDNLTGFSEEGNQLMSWIFTQPALVLDDVDIKCISESLPIQSFRLYKLSLHNSNQHHVLKGHATVNQKIPTSVTFAFAWDGDVFDPEKITAKSYVYLEGVILPQWLRNFTLHDLQVKQGLLSAKIWADWKEGSLKSVQTQFQVYELELYSLLTKKTQFITRMNGHLGWKVDKDRQIFAGEDIFIDFPDHLWPVTRFAVSTSSCDAFTQDLLPENSGKRSCVKASQDDVSIQIGYLDLSDTKEVLLATHLFPNDFENQLLAFNPRGEVFNLNATVRDLNQWDNNVFSAVFKKLSFDAKDKLPGFKNFTGDFDWDGEKGSMNVHSIQTVLNYPLLFVKPLVFDEMKGDISFKKNKDTSWDIQGNAFQITNADLNANTNLKMTIPFQGSPEVAFNANFTMADTVNIGNYIALKTLDSELKNWLKNAFQHGKITQGNVTLAGGKFSMSADFSDLHFNYAPFWPPMLHTNGNVTLTGSRMMVRIDSGQILHVPIKNIKGEIPYIGSLKPEILSVDASPIPMDLEKGFEIIQKSPLQKTLGVELQDLKAKGPMNLKLSLKIPLKKPDETTVLGEIATNNAELNFQTGLTIKELKGIFRFTEKTLDANRLQGKLFNEPITIDIGTTQKSKTASFIKIMAKSTISPATVQQFLNKTALQDVISGGSAFEAELILPSRKESLPNKLTIRSDLKGLAVNLPDGFGKKLDESTNFTLTSEMQFNQPLKAQLIFGKQFSVAARMKNGEKGLEPIGGEIRLGSNGLAQFQSQPGFLITGQFDTLSWEKIQSYLPKKSTEEESNTLMKYLRGINIKANKIMGFNEVLTNVRLQIEKLQNQWDVAIASTEMTGDITIPDSKTQPVNVKLQYLYLTTMDDPMHKTSLDIKDVPNMNFISNEVRLDKKSYGRVSFELMKNQNDIAIKTLRAESQFYQLRAEGKWLQNRTYLQGNLTTRDIGKFFGYFTSSSSNLVGSSGDLKFDLNWNDAPYTPSLSTMSGNANIKLSAGRVINLDRSTNAKMGFGRILNILSVESLARRLTFNFNDLSVTGYSFDSMTGSFNLRNGDAFTDNTRLDGSIARIEIKGRIGMAAKDYDITMSVTPYVTGSIPVVAAIAVNPLVGVAAWAVEKIASQALSSAATHRYNITGKWDNPQWREK